MTITIPNAIAEQLHSSLLERGFWEHDGFWYPLGEVSRSRVRIKIEGGLYTIQSRRSPQVPWTLLVRALVSDFDPDTFSRWCREWPLRFT